MAELSNYERLVFQEIDVWKAQRGGALSQTVKYVSDTPPIRWVVEHVPAVPERISQPVLRAVQGFLELLKDGAYWTYSDDAIVQAARREDLDVESIAALSDKDLEVLDRVARSFFAENMIAAALEGAGTGFGGLVLIAADIPAIFTVAFRTIQQVGASYGFDMKDPNATPLVMSVLGFASGAEKRRRLPPWRTCTWQLECSRSSGAIRESPSGQRLAARQMPSSRRPRKCRKRSPRASPRRSLLK